MRTMLDLSTSEFIGSGHDVSTLRRCLELSLEDCQEKSFKYVGQILGLNCSVRVFSQHPQDAFESSFALSCPIDVENLARELVRLAETEARYPLLNDSYGEKGWAIYKAIDDDRNLTVAAYAAWVDPS